MSAYPAEKHPFTWQDYRKLPERERWEIIDGEPYAMTSPSFRHQSILLKLGAKFLAHLADSKCRPIIAPFDVKFDDLNCTQPDLMVVCDPKQIKTNYIEGPPSLVVEISSTHGQIRDRIKKMKLYARFGVKEFWIVTQWPPMIEVFLLDGASYRLVGAFAKEDRFKSPGFPELELDLMALFDYPPEHGEEIEVVKEPPGRYARAEASVS